MGHNMVSLFPVFYHLHVLPCAGNANSKRKSSSCTLNHHVKYLNSMLDLGSKVPTIKKQNALDLLG